MLFSSLLDRFIKESPIAVMAQATISYALNAASLDAVFKENASAQYELKITFSALVDLMSLVVCQVYRSVNSRPGCPRRSPATVPRSWMATTSRLLSAA
jgi:hypothetical protein